MTTNKQSGADVIAHVARKAGIGWRVLQSPPVRILVATLCVVGVTTLLQSLAKAMKIAIDNGPGLLVPLLLIPAMCGAYVAYVRLVERRRVVEFGRNGALAEFASGALAGGALFGATVSMLWLADVWQLEGMRAWMVLAPALTLALATAFIEEILFRGIVFRIVEESVGSWLAVTLSAAGFGLAHGFNPGATVTSTAAIALEAGILLAAAYVLTRRLWLAIGLHFAWNFTESGIFGASTSGREAHGLFITRLTGPDLMTGGAFGPEASIVAVVLCLAAGIGLLVIAAQRRRIVAPAWRRR